MSSDSNNAEKTQPVKIQVKETLSEDTSRIIVVQRKPEPSTDIPGWLLEFASQPSEERDGGFQHGLESIGEPAPESAEADAPIVLETAEWHVVQGELESPLSTLIEDTADLSVEQTARELLDRGDFSLAADFVRKTATSNELANEFQLILRPYLVLQEDRQSLWSVYDELSAKFTQENIL